MMCRVGPGLNCLPCDFEKPTAVNMTEQINKEKYPFFEPRNFALGRLHEVPVRIPLRIMTNQYAQSKAFGGIKAENGDLWVRNRRSEKL
jgi:hypothetical protein